MELAPELPGCITAHVPPGFEQRRRPRQRPTAIHEVPGVLTPALGIPVEPRRAGGLGVLDPRLLLHSLRAGTPVLARSGGLAQAGRAGRNPGDRRDY